MLGYSKGILFEVNIRIAEDDNLPLPNRQEKLNDLQLGDHLTICWWKWLRVVCIHDEVDKGIDSHSIFNGRFECMIDSIQPERGHVVEGVKRNYSF